MIYSHLAQENTGIPIALQALGNYDLVDIRIPLGVNANSSDQLTISITEFNLPNNITVYLEDSYENTVTFLNSDDYVFTPDTDLLGTGRFFLSFTENSLSIEENTLSTINIFSESITKRIVINGILDKPTNAKIYDMQGRMVNSQDLNSNSTSQYMDVNYLSSGVYVVRLTNTIQALSKKIIIH